MVHECYWQEASTNSAKIKSGSEANISLCSVVRRKSSRKPSAMRKISSPTRSAWIKAVEYFSRRRHRCSTFTRNCYRHKVFMDAIYNAKPGNGLSRSQSGLHITARSLTCCPSTIRNMSLWHGEHSSSSSP